ncbi:growth hormone receptor isoform X2 [Labeo rohita]|uniref:growth hormone receptor isoform X2 n=1 Tax=Labeo rohita TaxID=84645 RepID=UPI0021E3070F|nr:growth hormone receptor isoform X2 [Labeo rohita]
MVLLRRVMLCFLLLTLHWTTNTVALQSSTRAAAVLKEDGRRPYIYHCRSPNMEIFTCWWRPIDSQDNVTYTLLYTIGQRAVRECPDYVSGGVHSCYFDAKHTQIWEMYCMNVTAHTRTGPVTSQKHCLDVVDIVEIDPPFNLTYVMLNESIGEVGRSILVSWLYPIESLVNEGLILLDYELRYRNLAQTDNWRVMERLREPHVELLDLPVGMYEFSARCRSTSNKHWSAWSESIIVTINGKALSERMLALILVTSVAIMAFLIISLGNVPQGKRIKSFFLPPIPKPRIPGLEPALLKKGKIDEISCHFSSFHGYKSPQYSPETWYQVSVDTYPAATPSKAQSDRKQEDVPITPIAPVAPVTQYVTCPDGQQSVQKSCSPAPYCHSPASYCEENTPPPDPGPAHPELTSVPGMDYSMILNPTAKQPSTQDFYTRVSGTTPAGTPHLVSCLPDTPYLQFKEGEDDDADKSSQLAALLEKQMEGLLSAIDSDPSKTGMPLLPHSSDRSCRSI